MPDIPTVLTVLGSVVILGPALLVVVFGSSTLLGRPLGERPAWLAVALVTGLGLSAAAGVFVLMLATNTRHVVLEFGDWVHLETGEGGHHHFAVKFVYDRLSVPFAALALALCGVVGAFAHRYMHRERGYNRFFTLYALFLAGMVVTALAGTIETLFFGWELVGLSSALLVGFFHERPAPVRNALRVWVVYRVSDAALLLAAILLHHLTGEGDFDQLTGYRGTADTSWPFGGTPLTPTQVLLVGGLLLIAAAGKSALVPFSGWLPRAMEGPTPSSAVFYGALSVHLGAFLLLRAGPVLDASPVLAGVVVALGLATAAFASLAGRVQSDIKSALSFAALTQVGLIVAEIGLGWRYIPLAHLVGHACLRTLQFVRAPSLLHDRHLFENALGDHVPRSSGARGGWLYRFALERGYLDVFLDRFVAGPVVRAFRWFDRLDRRATAALAGAPAEKPVPQPRPAEVEQPA